MVNNDLLALQEALKRLSNVVFSGSAPAAINELELLVAQWPRQPDVVHLAALAYKEIDDPENAIKYFERSLALNPKQPQVLNNFANLLKSRGEFEHAIKHYLSAISLQDAYLDAIRNLALCYYASGNFDAAEQRLIEVLNLSKGDLVALTTLGNCYRKTNRLELAKNKYREVIAINSDHQNALYNLGLTHHLSKELTEAISFYRRALDVSQRAEVLLSLAMTLNEVGQIDEAISLLNNHLERYPENIDAHEGLNSILWEADRGGDGGASYAVAINKFPSNEELRVSYVSYLLNTNNQKLAQTELDKALSAFGPTVRLRELEAKMQADRHEYKQAYATFSEVVEREFSIERAQQLVKVCIVLERYADAQKLIDRIFADLPQCQLTWALQGMVWNFCDDPRATWLNNYDQFIRQYQLPVPQGYHSLSEFLQKLNAVLLKQHTAQRQPLTQTLRLGTQTSPRLFHDKSRVIKELVSGISSILNRYINELPDDSTHPFLSRKTDSFQFSGSWSVKLQANGFHVNHVHPQGWISSSCYISLPSNMHTRSDPLAGAIKFGESPLPIGDRQCVIKTIAPTEGSVVLFPSYFWHGTYPFYGDANEYRLTSPFDVIPI